MAEMKIDGIIYYSPAYLIMKRGLYREQGCYIYTGGHRYTGIKDRAGRYPKGKDDEEVTYIRESDAPQFSPACWSDVKVKHLNAKITDLLAENDRQRQVVGMFSTVIDDLVAHGGYTVEDDFQSEVDAIASLQGDKS